MLLYPIFDGGMPSIRNRTTGEFLAGELDALEAAAEVLGVQPLSAFGDSRSVPGDFVGDPDELNEAMGPSTDWFDPSECAESCMRLADAIAADSGAFSVDAPGDVERELRDLARVLKSAGERGLRFRLELS